MNNEEIIEQLIKELKAASVVAQLNWFVMTTMQMMADYISHKDNGEGMFAMTEEQRINLANQSAEMAKGSYFNSMVFLTRVSKLLDKNFLPILPDPNDTSDMDEQLTAVMNDLQDSIAYLDDLGLTS
jgi:hypothetical protein